MNNVSYVLRRLGAAVLGSPWTNMSKIKAAEKVASAA
jgi:hypothetical protein